MSRTISLKWPSACRDCGANLAVGSTARYYGRGYVYGTECHPQKNGHNGNGKQNNDIEATETIVRPEPEPEYPAEIMPSEDGDYIGERWYPYTCQMPACDNNPAGQQMRQLGQEPAWGICRICKGRDRVIKPIKRFRETGKLPPMHHERSRTPSPSIPWHVAVSDWSPEWAEKAEVWWARGPWKEEDYRGSIIIKERNKE